MRPGQKRKLPLRRAEELRFKVQGFSACMTDSLCSCRQCQKMTSYWLILEAGLGPPGGGAGMVTDLPPGRAVDWRA